MIYLVSAASCPHKLYERKKTTPILLHSREMNALNPAGLCGHGMWLGTPNAGGGSARCKVFFEGHSVAPLEAQMVKNSSDRNFPPTYRYLCPFPLMLQVAPFLSLWATQHSSSPDPRPHSLLMATGAVWRRQSLPASGVVGRPGQWWPPGPQSIVLGPWVEGLEAWQLSQGRGSHSSQALPRRSGPTGARIPSLGGGLWSRG